MKHEPLNETHCRCGTKWGEHKALSADDIKINLFCVVCNSLIKGQCLERYLISGNYCGKCNGQFSLNNYKDIKNIKK